jgi:hypothetical protein
MSTNTNKLDPRITSRLACAIVRAWPSETREWGQAFASELPAAETSQAAVSWLIGGAMLLLREWLKHAWRSLGRPIGAGANKRGGAFIPHSRAPRTPLWLILGLTLSSAALLLHPEMRQVLGSLRFAYTNTEMQPDRWSSVKALRDISKTNRDPRLLALLSLLSDNDDERLRLSEEAIEKDPSLTWLDYEQSLLPLNDLSKRQYLSQRRLERLQKWDPGNAVPHLLAAEIVSKPARAEAFDALMRGKADFAREKSLATNSQWISEMEAAFTAPKYDSYMSQAIELVQEVSSQFPVRDPEIAAAVLTRKRMAQFDVFTGYARFLMERGASLQRAGNVRDAIGTYSEVLQFAQRLGLNAEIPAERFAAQSIGEKAGAQLEPLYAAVGRSDEASLIGFQLAEWKTKRTAKMFRNAPLIYREAQWKSLAWSGLLINVAGLLLVGIFPLALISILFVVRRRKTPAQQRGWTDFCASICADAAPWLLLASAGLLFVTYHPYASLCRAFLIGGPSAPDVESFLDAAAVPYVLPTNAEFLHDPVYGWSSLTAALCILLVFFFWRVLLRSKPAA